MRLLRVERGRGSRRVVNYLAQYKCLDCGHVGWTRHRSPAGKLKAQLGHDPADLLKGEL